MSRYAHGSSLNFFFLFLFFIPLVFSQLTPNQKNIIIKISKLVNWNTTDSNPCSWKGVTCNSNNNNNTSFITHLSFYGLGLSTSDFLQDLCQINSLESLDLSVNLLTSIPDVFITDCGEIAGLKMLNFSKNKLSGPLPTFHGFVGLESLDLSGNALSGEVGLQLDALVGIKSLNLSLNMFNGSIPFSKSLVLKELQLSKNRFQGPIPEELVGRRNLTLIDLSFNSLSGSVPISIGDLSKLETLLLSSNSLGGEIPESLSRIKTLSRLGANQNRLTGIIPSGISQYVRILDLSFNNLTGSIPDDFLSSPNLQSVDLSYNSLVGSIPTNMSSNLFRLRLGSNLLKGRIPPASILKLTYLELDNNSLSGEIPLELGSCESLALLNLAQNELTGPLPKELGNLRQLQVMKLQFNRLIGEIPGQISQLENLSILNISHNLLDGSIPPSISRLQKLEKLNLQDNKLNGSIPASISSLNSLLELQLGKNCLRRPIPRMPISLQIALNLSNNCFDGPIPDTLAGLSELEVVDLSNNRFTGEIPTFLTQMGSLTQLLLSNNQLSGYVPQFKQFVDLETSGNKDLIYTTTASNPPISSKKRKTSVTVAVLIAVAGAVLAVGIVCGVFVLVSRRFYRVNDENLHTEEQLALPQVINGHLITTNSLHKSGIDFTTAMKAVSNPTNIILKSRFSTYYKAVMPCGTNYYVKKLNWSDKIFQLGSHEKFGQELEVLGRLRNSNVMIPLAYVLTVDNAYLFYEYAQKGTLFDVLHGSLGTALDWTSRHNIAVGIAQGLAFLHGCSTGPVLLLDLSSKSILLKSLTEPQIGDIELCKVIDPSKSTGSLSTIAGSVGYIPPEYAYTMRVTMPGNVYSFGVILLELLTGRPAVSEGTELAKWVLGNSIQQETWDQILDLSVSRTSFGVRSQMLSVLKIALSCVSVSPEVRPKMMNVLTMLLNAR